MKSVYNNYPFFIIFFFPLFSQGQTQAPKLPLQEHTNQRIANNLRLKKEIWEFDSPDTIASKSFSAKDVGNTTYITYFDELSKKINILSMNECEMIKQIDIGNSLTKENFFESLYFHNLDTIFVQEHKNIKMIDKDGNLKFSVPVNQSEERSKMTLRNLDYVFPIIYDHSFSKNLLIGQYCSDCRFYEKKYFRQNIETSLNLSTKKFKETPFIYPPKFQQEYFGFATFVYHTINDSLSIFTFMADANIYILNKKTGSVEIKRGKSKYDTSIKSLSIEYKNNRDKKMNHLIQSPLYFGFYWDPYRKLYYRIFLKEQPEKNADGSNSIWMGKPRVLMVFDENFQVIDELELSWDYSHSMALVTSKGFLIKKEDVGSVNKLVFEVFKFER